MDVLRERFIFSEKKIKIMFVKLGRKVYIELFLVINFNGFIFDLLNVEIYLGIVRCSKFSNF